MSEYQYYEFLAVDRPLSQEERKEVGKISSRTDASATHAVFTYSYSDFPRNPKEILYRYFDALLYMANWGSRRLAFRFPRNTVDLDAFQKYAVEDVIEVDVDDRYVILDVSFNEEESDWDWIEGGGILASLVALRQDLLQGDLRMLYLVWLKVAMMTMEDADDEYEDEPFYKIYPDTLEPPVPANMRSLSGPLEELIQFFEIDPESVEIAAETSIEEEKIAEAELVYAIKLLSEAEKRSFLERLARNEPNLGLDFQRRLGQLVLGDQPEKDEAPRRKAKDLFEAIEHRRVQVATERKKAAEAARLKRLEELAETAPQLWEEVFSLIEKKKGNAYDQAVIILKKLRELAVHQGALPEFRRRVQDIRQTYRNLSALMRRLDKVG